MLNHSKQEKKTGSDIVDTGFRIEDEVKGYVKVNRFPITTDKEPPNLSKEMEQNEAQKDHDDHRDQGKKGSEVGSITTPLKCSSNLLPCSR